MKEASLLKIRNFVLGVTAHSASHNAEKLLIPGVIYHSLCNKNGKAYLII